MIKIQSKLSREVYVACSGGVDSMAVVDFLRNNHDVNIVFFNHGTETSDQAHEFLTWYCHENSIPMMLGVLPSNLKRSKDTSPEEFWRKERYKFFHSINRPVITCHHLDDCVETWVWSSMHGTSKVIPFRNRNVIRPFRLNRKREFELWCHLKNVPYIEDDTNNDTCYTRNYIRHKMMPHVLRVNPGIHKTVAKKVKEIENWP